MSNTQVYQYQAVMSNKDLLKELDEWNDVCLTVSMNSWTEGLGGYVPEIIPERFEVLANAYLNKEICFLEGISAIEAQWGR